MRAKRVVLSKHVITKARLFWVAWPYHPGAQHVRVDRKGEAIRRRLEG